MFSRSYPLFENLRHTSYIWTCTAIGTPRHPHDNGVVTETILFTYFFDLVDEQWQVLKRERS